MANDKARIIKDDLTEYSETVLQAFWYEIMVKFEREESEELITMLEIVEGELKKRSEEKCLVTTK
ncbi:hypothetical protein [Bacillus infantis]|uniref:Uncharacterized protein n=1 Tax=Bacillus infantis TaxID=324767 RepID=A0A5D4R5X7_9BACI|nr:hypothetical protein [Bacillus infantis]TYS46775.1 hypothetical protein FZD51_14990 [Bacillus infantis]